MPVRGQVDFVAAKHQIDWYVQLRNIAGRQVEHGLLDFKADAFGGGEMPQNRVEPIAGPRERIDDPDCRPARSLRNHIPDIASYRLTEWGVHGLNAGSRQDAHAPPPPLLRRHTVKMDVVRIAETVAPVLLHLPQFDELVALGRAEQKIAIVLRRGTIGTLRGHAPSIDNETLPSFPRHRQSARG